MAGSPLLLPLGAAACFAAIAFAGLELLPRPVSGDDDGGAAEHRPGLGRRLAGVAERVLVERGWQVTLTDALERAGVRSTAGEFCLLVALAGAAAALLTGAVAGPLVALVVLVLSPAVAHTIVARRRATRQRRFAEQVVTLLPALAASLRAGHSLIQAVELSSRELVAPAGDELRRVAAEVHLGRDQVEALGAMADRYDCDDLRWLVSAVQIHREVGGDLTRVLDRVADTIRARDHLARHVRTLTAEGRAQAKVLAAMPVCLAVVLSLLNPDYLRTFVDSATGLFLLGGAAVLVAVGTLWLRVITRVEA